MSSKNNSTTFARSESSCDDPRCLEGQRLDDGLSRRSFLGRAVALGSTGALVGILGEGSSTRLAFGGPTYAGDTVVVLSLRGGFDGLSAVAPIGDPAYAAARPSIAVPGSRALSLDSMFGLHPALAPLHKLFTTGSLAVIQAVGQATRTRSHFAAMQEMENAAPGSYLRTGWIDRMAGLSASATPFSTVAVSSGGAPAAMMGPNPELVLRSLDSFQLSGATGTDAARWKAALQALHGTAPAVVKEPALAALAGAETAGAVSAATLAPDHGAVYPSGDVGESLREVARLVRAGVGLRVATVDVGDWDMHAGIGSSDRGWMFDRLTKLGQALAAFALDLGERMADVTLVTLSEFGRRVAENGSGGLDHGHGNACIVMGGGVVGGKVYGRWPGLGAGELDDGDLAGTTDYRTILAEILERRAKLDSSVVFPGLGADRLGLVRMRG